MSRGGLALHNPDSPQGTLMLLPCEACAIQGITLQSSDEQAKTSRSASQHAAVL